MEEKNHTAICHSEMLINQWTLHKKHTFSLTIALCTETRMVNEPKTSGKEFMGTKGRRKCSVWKCTQHHTLDLGNGDKHQIHLSSHCKVQQYQLTTLGKCNNHTQIFNDHKLLHQKKRLCRCCNCLTEMSCASLRHCVSEIDQRNKEGRYETWTGCVTPFCVPELPCGGS